MTLMACAPQIGEYKHALLDVKTLIYLPELLRGAARLVILKLLTLLPSLLRFISWIDADRITDVQLHFNVNSTFHLIFSS